MGQGDVAESIDIIMQSKEFFGKAVYRYIAVINTKARWLPT
jgi:hypothetical protein